MESSLIHPRFICDLVHRSLITHSAVLHYKGNIEVKEVANKQTIGSNRPSLPVIHSLAVPLLHTAAQGFGEPHYSSHQFSCRGTVQTAQVDSQIKHGLELQRTTPQMEHSCQTWEWWGAPLASMAEGCDLSQYLLEKENWLGTHTSGDKGQRCPEEPGRTVRVRQISDPQISDQGCPLDLLG